MEPLTIAGLGLAAMFLLILLHVPLGWRWAPLAWSASR